MSKRISPRIAAAAITVASLLVPATAEAARNSGHASEQAIISTYLAQNQARDDYNHFLMDIGAGGAGKATFSDFSSFVQQNPDLPPPPGGPPGG